MNFQMFKLVLEKAEEPEIKLPTSCCFWYCCSVSSVVSDSVRPHRQQPTRRPCPWDSPGKNTGEGCHFLLHANIHWTTKKKQESSRKTSTSASLTTPKPLTVWITTNWKILKEMGIPDHLTCLLRNLCAGQEATVRTGHGTKGVHQGYMLSPCLFNLYAQHIM